MSSLKIRQLKKKYGAVEVLSDINLEAQAGEFIVLVGPSGCGKSTLLAMIAGLESVTAGEIWIGERIVNSVAPKDRDIAMVFQSYALYPTMTVRENMAFGMESRGIPKEQQKEAIERVSSLLQIQPLLARKPGQLSGGQRQRVAMGRALVRDPELFLFDEPLSNLDAKLRVEMRTEIKRLHQRVGKTTVYVTHDQVEAMTLASRIAVMHRGSLQQFDVPDVIYNRPANMFVAGFMGSPAMNFIPATVTGANGKPMASVVLGDGKQVHLSLANPPSGLEPGREIMLGLRPEHFYRYEPDLVARKPAIEKVSMQVDVVEPTGAETVAVLRLGPQEVTGSFEPDGAPQWGETVDIGVDMSRACLFDPKSQQLI